MELSRNEKLLVRALKESGGRATIDDLMKRLNLSIVEVMNAASWLKMKGAVKIEEKLRIEYRLSSEGEKCLRLGLPEKRLLDRILESKVALIDDLKRELGNETVSLGIAYLKGNGIEIKEGKIILSDPEKARATVEMNMYHLKNFQDVDEEIKKKLLKRGLIEKKESIERVIFLTSIGESISEKDLELRDEITQLTPQDIQTGSWKNKELKRYDIRMFTPLPDMGREHPISEFISRVRRIFLSMGFMEIDGDYIVPAFWNMDALFIPQDHPARDMQDTFYMDSVGNLPDYAQTVKKIHENGGGISRGWKYSWDSNLAVKNILRTHTTVNSIKYLYDHREEDIIRVFMIGRVFRRENMDPTHLPEFHQIEGIMVEPGSNFSMLLGTLHRFYSSLGFEKIKFKPSYFPYTEPSVEVHVLSEGGWLELGGAGVFRPEVTLPLGIKNRVLAWGLGLERLAMLYYGLKDIRDLYIADLDKLKSLPLL
ncbi:MAG: phenylalanine--tRNA ligase subunit alpha [Thermoplasmata archaeon]|jgi:phenylalanyl-tRNA synthetase alpha chain|nr:phenylalanine--tRNA ligase subunit alpha [Thermoplasmatales archaeon]